MLSPSIQLIDESTIMAISQPATFVTLILDPDAKSRMRTKAATVEIAEFRTVQHTASTEEALSRLACGEPVDIILVSECLGAEKIK